MEFFICWLIFFSDPNSNVNYGNYKINHLMLLMKLRPTNIKFQVFFNDFSSNFRTITFIYILIRLSGASQCNAENAKVFRVEFSCDCCQIVKTIDFLFKTQSAILIKRKW